MLNDSLFHSHPVAGKPPAPDPAAVSVIIPTYNRAEVVPRAVKSALGQCLPGDEVIVVDDGSTDHTERALAPFAGRIRYLRTSNRGAGSARNRGIHAARNPLLAFLDSDDEWMPGKLQLQRSLMQALPGVQACFSDFCVCDWRTGDHHWYGRNWHGDRRSWDEILGPGVPFSSLCPLPASVSDFAVHVGDLYPATMREGYVFTSTVMARRAPNGSVVHFSEDIPFHEDYVYFALLARTGDVAYMNCETAWQHAHARERLSSTDVLDKSVSRIAALERIYGCDPDFMARHGDSYRQELQLLRLRKAKRLISLGRTPEARQELRFVSNPPRAYVALASLPGVLVFAARQVALGALRLKRSARGVRFALPRLTSENRA
jgi:glycosyltransferase involved in cell wall biosynthesis